MDVLGSNWESRLEGLHRRVVELRDTQDLNDEEALAELEKVLDELEELGKLVEEDR